MRRYFMQNAICNLKVIRNGKHFSMGLANDHIEGCKDENYFEFFSKFCEFMMPSLKGIGTSEQSASAVLSTSISDESNGLRATAYIGPGSECVSDKTVEMNPHPPSCSGVTLRSFIGLNEYFESNRWQAKGCPNSNLNISAGVLGDGSHAVDRNIFSDELRRPFQYPIKATSFLFLSGILFLIFSSTIICTTPLEMNSVKDAAIVSVVLFFSVGTLVENLLGYVILQNGREYEVDITMKNIKQLILRKEDPEEDLSKELLSLDGNKSYSNDIIELLSTSQPQSASELCKDLESVVDEPSGNLGIDILNVIERKLLRSEMAIDTAMMVIPVIAKKNFFCGCYYSGLDFAFLLDCSELACDVGAELLSHKSSEKVLTAAAPPCKTEIFSCPAQQNKEHVEYIVDDRLKQPVAHNSGVVRTVCLDRNVAGPTDPRVIEVSNELPKSKLRIFSPQTKGRQSYSGVSMLTRPGLLLASMLPYILQKPSEQPPQTSLLSSSCQKPLIGENVTSKKPRLSFPEEKASGDVSLPSGFQEIGSMVDQNKQEIDNLSVGDSKSSSKQKMSVDRQMSTLKVTSYQSHDINSGAVSSSSRMSINTLSSVGFYNRSNLPSKLHNQVSSELVSSNAFQKIHSLKEEKSESKSIFPTEVQLHYPLVPSDSDNSYHGGKIHEEKIFITNSKILDPFQTREEKSTSGSESFTGGLGCKRKVMAALASSTTMESGTLKRKKSEMLSPPLKTSHTSETSQYSQHGGDTNSSALGNFDEAKSTSTHDQSIKKKSRENMIQKNIPNYKYIDTSEDTASSIYECVKLSNTSGEGSATASTVRGATFLSDESCSSSSEVDSNIQDAAKNAKFLKSTSQTNLDILRTCASKDFHFGRDSQASSPLPINRYAIQKSSEETTKDSPSGATYGRENQIWVMTANDPLRLSNNTDKEKKCEANNMDESLSSDRYGSRSTSDTSCQYYQEKEAIHSFTNANDDIPERREITRLQYDFKEKAGLNHNESFQARDATISDKGGDDNFGNNTSQERSVLLKRPSYDTLNTGSSLLLPKRRRSEQTADQSSMDEFGSIGNDLLSVRKRIDNEYETSDSSGTTKQQLRHTHSHAISKEDTAIGSVISSYEICSDERKAEKCLPYKKRTQYGRGDVSKVNELPTAIDEIVNMTKSTDGVGEVLLCRTTSNELQPVEKFQSVKENYITCRVESLHSLGKITKRELASISQPEGAHGMEKCKSVSENSQFEGAHKRKECKSVSENSQFEGAHKRKECKSVSENSQFEGAHKRKEFKSVSGTSAVPEDNKLLSDEKVPQANFFAKSSERPASSELVLATSTPAELQTSSSSFGSIIKLFADIRNDLAKEYQLDGSVADEFAQTPANKKETIASEVDTSQHQLTNASQDSLEGLRNLSSALVDLRTTVAKDYGLPTQAEE